MKPSELRKAFDGDVEAATKALRCDRSQAHRIMYGTRLVPILKAFRLHEDDPIRFPNPPNWKDYEAEQARLYRGNWRKRRKSAK